MTHDSRRDLWLIPALVVAAHAVVLVRYGWFRDEFYYLACAAHLDYGYVDHPALSILPLWLIRLVLGDSLIAIRLLAAVVMAAAAWATGRLTEELGGRPFARVLAMTCVAITPEALAVGSYYSMNAFDMFIWACGCWLFLRALRTSATRDWLLLGVALGLGLENKISVLWLGGGLFAGLALADPRRLLTRGPWIAGVTAAVLFAPYVAWQLTHDWASLEFIRGASSGKMAARSMGSFLRSQMLDMHPVTLPVWLAGLYALLVRPVSRGARALGVMFLAVLAVLLLNSTSRSGYLAPAYAPLFAAGAAWWAQRLAARAWLRPAVVGTIVAAGIVTAPLAMPVLPVDTYIRYAAALGKAPSTEEKKEVSDLPQFYADRFGWTELVDGVDRVYRSLAPDEQRVTSIYTSNYGEAGAIDVLGRRRGLPPALSGHNNYWYWKPATTPSAVVIVLLPADARANLEARFESVVVAGTIECAHCMPYENHRPIFVCRRPRTTLDAIWPRVKHFD